MLASAAAAGATAAPSSAALVRASVDFGPIAVGGKTYMLARSTNGKTLLVRTDGTPAGTKVVQQLCIPPGCQGPARLTAFGNRLLVATNGERGAVYLSAAGGERLTRRFGGRSDSKRFWVTFTSGRRLFVAQAVDARGARWTVSEADLQRDRLTRLTPQVFGSPIDLAGAGRSVLFAAASADGTESLWNVSRGKATKLAGHGTQGPLLTAVGGGRYLFGGFDRAHGNEPWITDGTVRGTKMVSDFSPGTDSSGMSVVHAGGKHVIGFVSRTGGAGSLVRQNDAGSFATIADGPFSGIETTAAGRVIVRTFDGTPEFVDPVTGDWTPIFGSPIGAGAQPIGPDAVWQTDGQLWWADGATTTTRKLRAFSGSCPRGCNPGISELTVVNDRAYIVADPSELWTTDGTEAGTVQLVGRAPAP